MKIVVGFSGGVSSAYCAGLSLLAVLGFWRLLQLPAQALAARTLRRPAVPPNTERG